LLHCWILLLIPLKLIGRIRGTEVDYAFDEHDTITTVLGDDLSYLIVEELLSLFKGRLNVSYRVNDTVSVY
jgi:hypothetical protein